MCKLFLYVKQASLDHERCFVIYCFAPRLEEVSILPQKSFSLTIYFLRDVNTEADETFRS